MFGAPYNNPYPGVPAVPAPAAAPYNWGNNNNNNQFPWYNNNNNNQFGYPTNNNNYGNNNPFYTYNPGNPFNNVQQPFMGGVGGYNPFANQQFGTAFNWNPYNYINTTPTNPWSGLNNWPAYNNAGNNNNKNNNNNNGSNLSSMFTISNQSQNTNSSSDNSSNSNSSSNNNNNSNSGSNNNSSSNNDTTTTTSNELAKTAITADELKNLMSAVDNDFTKNLLQLMSLLVERDRKLFGRYDDSAMFDIMNNSMNTNNLINSVASLLNVVNRADRMLGDSESTASGDLRDQILNSRSHIQKIGKLFYERVNQLSNVNKISPATDRRLTLINSAVAVSDVVPNPLMYDLAVEIMTNFNTIMIKNAGSNKYTLNPNFRANPSGSRVRENEWLGAQNRVVSTFLAPTESFNKIKTKYLNLRPLDLDLAEFIATNMPLGTLLAMANSMGFSTDNLDMQLINLIRATSTSTIDNSFTIARKNMIQRQPESPDDILSTHMVEGDLFYRKMAIATVLYNLHDRRETVDTTSQIVELAGRFHPGNQNNNQLYWAHYVYLRWFTLPSHQTVAGNVSNVFRPNNATEFPVMIPSKPGDTYRWNNQTAAIPTADTTQQNVVNANYDLMTYIPSNDTSAQTYTQNSSYYYVNVLLDIVAKFCNQIEQNPIARLVNIQGAMTEIGYNSDNLSDFLSELIKENEEFNIVPPCATNKYDLKSLKDLAKIMGIPQDEIDKNDNKLELCDMIVKADNQSGATKGRLFARSGAAVGVDNPHVIGVRRKLDTVFRRAFTDWVVNTYVLPTNFENISYTDYQNNVNVFDKLVSNERVLQSAKANVIAKLKNVRGPSKNILTGDRLRILSKYMAAFRDMDAAIYTEMRLDQIRSAPQ